VLWPLIQERERAWDTGAFQIEPGERDVVACEFIFEGGLETVEVYSYFKNESKKRGGREIGWGLTTLYDFKGDPASPVAKTAEVLTGKGA
jgi:hypothetical protein